MKGASKNGSTHSDKAIAQVEQTISGLHHFSRADTNAFTQDIPKIAVRCTRTFPTSSASCKVFKTTCTSVSPICVCLRLSVSVEVFACRLPCQSLPVRDCPCPSLSVSVGLRESSAGCANARKCKVRARRGVPVTHAGSRNGEAILDGIGEGRARVWRPPWAVHTMYTKT